MTEPIYFYDPRPPVGVICDPAAALAYPEPLPADAVQMELLDAELRATGQVVLQVCYQGADQTDNVVMSDVREGVDGCLAMTLASGELLVFAPADRERVTATVLKLSTGYS